MAHCNVFFALQVDDFLQALINYDKEHIPENCLKVVKEQYLRDPEFNPNLIRTKSFAAAGLCAWVINIMKFYEVYQAWPDGLWVVFRKGRIYILISRPARNVKSFDI